MFGPLVLEKACCSGYIKHTSSKLGLMLDLVVLLTPFQELFLASGGLHMLNTDMNPLGDDSAIYLLRTRL